MLTLRLARTKIATALVAVVAALALAAPLALAGTGGKSADYKPAGSGSGKRVR